MLVVVGRATRPARLASAERRVPGTAAGAVLRGRGSRLWMIVLIVALSSRLDRRRSARRSWSRRPFRRRRSRPRGDTRRPRRRRGRCRCCARTSSSPRRRRCARRCRRRMAACRSPAGAGCRCCGEDPGRRAGQAQALRPRCRRACTRRRRCRSSTSVTWIAPQTFEGRVASAADARVGRHGAAAVDDDAPPAGARPRRGRRSRC